MRYVLLFSVCVLFAAPARSFAQADSTHTNRTGTIVSSSTGNATTTLQQPILAPKPVLNWTRVGIATGSLVGAIVALHIYQNHAWWSGQRSPFHVFEDPAYQADFDKFGHTFGAYYSCYFFDQAYQWSGMDSGQASLFGALSGALWEYYVEIEDGYAQAWGFSRGDAKSDILGATFYLFNQRVPFLRNFRYKWFYVPTNKLIRDKPDIPGQTVNAIEDYGGQTYYLSADIHNMLPDSWRSYWPKWLNLAAGVSGYDINSIDYNSPSGNASDLRKKAWYLALDYDIDKIIPPSSSGFVNFILRSLGYWHFPAPAYRFYPNPKFFWLFPISITIDHGLHIGAETSLGGT